MTFAFRSHISEFPHGQGKGLHEEDRLFCLWEPKLVCWSPGLLSEHKKKAEVSPLGKDVPSFSEPSGAISPSLRLCAFSLVAEQIKLGLLPRALPFPCPLALWAVS